MELADAITILAYSYIKGKEMDAHIVQAKYTRGYYDANRCIDKAENVAKEVETFIKKNIKKEVKNENSSNGTAGDACNGPLSTNGCV